MAVSWVAVYGGTGTSNSPAPGTFTPSNGHSLIAYIFDILVVGITAAPTGWVLVGKDANQAVSIYKFNNVSGTPASAWTLASSSPWAVAIQECSGTDTTSCVDVSGINTTATTPAVTPTVTGGLPLLYYAGNAGTSFGATGSVTGYTADATGSVYDNGVSISASEAALHSNTNSTTAQITGKTVTWTQAQTAQHASIVVVKPAASVTTVVVSSEIAEVAGRIAATAINNQPIAALPFAWSPQTTFMAAPPLGVAADLGQPRELASLISTLPNKTEALRQEQFVVHYPFRPLVTSPFSKACSPFVSPSVFVLTAEPFSSSSAFTLTVESFGAPGVMLETDFPFGS